MRHPGDRLISSQSGIDDVNSRDGNIYNRPRNISKDDISVASDKTPTPK